MVQNVIYDGEIGGVLYTLPFVPLQTHLALYCFANSQVSTALKLLYRARYLALLVCGENHPEIALLDVSKVFNYSPRTAHCRASTYSHFYFLQSNISLILHAVGEFELSLRFLEKALALNIRYYGANSIKVAVSYHLVARTQSCMGDFRAALNSEKETYAIYKRQVCSQLLVSSFGIEIYFSVPLIKY